MAVYNHWPHCHHLALAAPVHKTVLKSLLCSSSLVVSEFFMQEVGNQNHWAILKRLRLAMHFFWGGVIFDLEKASPNYSDLWRVYCISYKEEQI